MSKQKVKEAMKDLGRHEPEKRREPKKLALEIGGKKKTVKINERDTDITVSDKLAIIQMDEDIKSGEAEKKGYKRPKRDDFKANAQSVVLEYLK